MSKTRQPEVLWAQRSSKDDAEKNLIYLTIMASDVVKPNINLTSTGLKFSGNNKEIEYQFDLEFYDEIDPEKSQIHESPRAIVLKLQKKELNESYWPRLTKGQVKLHFLKTDFDKWVDEDEQDGGEEPAMGNQDFSSMLGGMGGMGGMAGMGGMGGMDMSKFGNMDDYPEEEEEDDDDDLPELEDISKDGTKKEEDKA